MFAEHLQTAQGYPVRGDVPCVQDASQLTMYTNRQLMERSPVTHSQTQLVAPGVLQLAGVWQRGGMVRGREVWVSAEGWCEQCGQGLRSSMGNTLEFLHTCDA